MDKVQFQTNVPVEVALRFLDGRECNSQFGGSQLMFTTTDERVFFVSPEVGRRLRQQLAYQQIQPGEAVDICKAEVDKGKGRKGIEWRVARVSPLGEQANGTLAVPASQVATGVTAPTGAMAAPTKAPGPSINGYGLKPGNGHNAQPFAASRIKIPIDVAVIDAVRIVQAAMRATGEQWSDGARQDLVSTVLITAQREGWLAVWSEGVGNV